MNDKFLNYLNKEIERTELRIKKAYELNDTNLYKRRIHNNNIVLNNLLKIKDNYIECCQIKENF